MKNINFFYLLLITSFVFSDPPNWDSNGDGLLDNLNDYQNNGSITSAIIYDGASMGSSGDILGAFVNDELRGISIASEVPFGPYAGSYQFLMLIYSNQANGETVLFQFYDVETDLIYDITESIEFVSDMTLGTVVLPEILFLIEPESDGGNDSGSQSNMPDWDSDGDGYLDNLNDYQNNGSITSAINLDGVSFGSLGDILGAFINDELRGVSFASEVPFGPYVGTYQFLMLIYSNQANGETVSFQFYDIETDLIYDVTETIEFVSDMTLGTVVSPEILTLVQSESDGGACDDVDLDEICDDIDDCVGQLDECGVCNGNGIADGECDCDGNTLDCAEVCGGSAVVDDCDVCEGNNDCLGCQEGFVESPLSTSDDIICVPEQFSYNQSTIQASYLFFEVNIDGNVVGNDDWVGAFNGDVCVGAQEWNVDECGGGICSITVMGFDGNSFTQGYMSNGGLPTFKIYDTSESTYFDAYPSSNYPYANLSFFPIDYLSTIETIQGCIDENACNYDEDANLDDESCEYAQENFDCDNNCLLTVDCNGVCGGNAIVDECGVCDGLGIVDGTCDCDGNTLDECGICGGDGSCTPPEFYFNQSSLQAFYFFQIASIDLEVLEPEDWVGVFNGDICVGAKKWDTSLCSEGVCEIAVMGDDDSSYTEGYMNFGEVPSFKIFDYSSGNIYSAIPSEENEWADLGLFIVDSLNVYPDCNGDIGGSVGDSDNDGVCDDVDICPGFDDNLDTDGDQIVDCLDDCSNDIDNDIDDDGICGDVDQCPNDFNNDIDGDGICGDIDECPVDINNDSDGDGSCDSDDICPNENDFLDSDGDQIVDCLDLCPNDPENDADEDGLCCSSSIGLTNFTYFGAFENNSYYYSNGLYSGLEARTLSENVGGFLVSINSEEENNFLGNIPFDIFWIGLYQNNDDSPWVWADGTEFNYSNWRSDQPNGTNQNCVDFLPDASISSALFEGQYNVWTDGDCNDLQRFILEIPQQNEDICCYDPENDFDGDGVCGNVDDCPYDLDNDLDGDGICGDVDDCPNDTNNDSDEDGTCDSEDICPGFDDFLDTDNDSVVDCLEVDGCIDLTASNFNDEATDDDGSCIYNYEINYNAGPNLISYYVLPDEDMQYNTENLLTSNYNIDNVLALMGENQAVAFTENGMYGSMLQVDRLSGYWLKIINSEVVNLSGYKTESDVLYQINQGSNLISFPSSDAFALEDVLPLSLDDVVYAILSEDEAAYYQDGQWVGSLSSLQGFNGYWFKSNAPAEFSFTIPDNALARSVVVDEPKVLEGYTYNQSTSRAFYFVKEIPEAKIGDWIIAMHDNQVVGTRQWNGAMVDIPVMGSDNELYSYGYVDKGSIPEFKLYHSDTGEIEDLSGDTPEFINNEIFIVNTLNTDNLIIPGEITLSEAYPNPFNPTTNITFNIPNTMNVELNILDINGRLVQRLVNGSHKEGSHNIKISGEQLASGLYFVELLTHKTAKYSKILLLK